MPYVSDVGVLPPLDRRRRRERFVAHVNVATRCDRIPRAARRGRSSAWSSGVERTDLLELSHVPEQATTAARSAFSAILGRVTALHHVLARGAAP